MDKKQCQMCNKTLPVSKFHKNKSTKDGYSSYCAKCKLEANKRSDNKRLSENREKFLNQRKNWHLKQAFGITLEEYNIMLESQNGVCAICHQKDDNKMLSVDHNHETGEVRGLLCSKCNFVIGLLDESIERCENTIQYLKEKNHWY